jgi:hypothetical protein
MRVLAVAPIVTLVVSFCIVFGLGLLIGPAPTPAPVPTPPETSQPEEPSAPPLNDRDKGARHSTGAGKNGAKAPQGGHPGGDDQ